MKLNLNNSELVVILKALEVYFEVVPNDDFLSIATIKSLVKKINGNCTVFNPIVEELAITCLYQLRDIEELMEEE